MSIALVLGGSESVWCDIESLETLVGGEWAEHDHGAAYERLMGTRPRPCRKHKRSVHRLPTDWPGAVYIANDFACWWPHPFDWWCTLHANNMHPPKVGSGTGWVEDRERNGYPDGYRTCTGTGKRAPGFDRAIAAMPGGSSGLLTVAAALEDGYIRLLGCGLQMDQSQHFPESLKHQQKGAWSGYRSHRRAWNRPEVVRVLNRTLRSCSGWTREQFGEPDAYFMEGANGREDGEREAGHPVGRDQTRATAGGPHGEAA